MDFGDILEVEADLQELEQLLGQAQRAKVRSLIQAEVDRLKVSKTTTARGKALVCEC